MRLKDFYTLGHGAKAPTIEWAGVLNVGSIPTLSTPIYSPGLSHSEKDRLFKMYKLKIINSNNLSCNGVNHFKNHIYKSRKHTN